MYWLIFAVLTPVLFALGDLVEKFQIDRVFRHWLSYFIMAYAAWSLIVAAIFLIEPVSFNAFFILLGMASGILGTAGSVFYLKAISKEEASRVVPLSFIGIAFTAVLAHFLLAESFSPVTYLSIALLVAGSFVISLKGSMVKGKKALVLTPVIGLIIVSAIFGSVGDIVSKTFLLSVDYWSLLVWNYIGGLFVVGVLFLDKGNRANFPKMKDLRCGRKVWTLLLCTMAVYFIAEMTYFAALTEAPLSIVASICTTEPFFVLMLAAGLRYLRPKNFDEEVGGTTMAMKILSTLLIVLGAFLATV